MKNNFILLLSIFLWILIGHLQAQNFEREQRKFPRVRTAFSEKETTVQTLFKKAQVRYPPRKIFIRIFKYERRLELWAMGTDTDTFKIITKYPFCSSSGELGPKRRQGDFQIPEGFYYIDRFNPMSNFYLSLGLNYPNASDRILGKKGNLGGDIFIHGDCVTIGCIPITDDKIKELYLIAVKAKSNGQKKIPVHIFPFNFSDKKNGTYFKTEKAYSRFQAFWQELKPAFFFFEKYRRLQPIRINKQSGQYYQDK